MKKSSIPDDEAYLNSSLKYNETSSDIAKKIMTDPEVPLNEKDRNAQIQRPFALNMNMNKTNSKVLNKSQININTKTGLRHEKVTTRKESFIEDTSNATEFSTSKNSSNISNQTASLYANYSSSESIHNSTSDD